MAQRLYDLLGLDEQLGIEQLGAERIAAARRGYLPASPAARVLAQPTAAQLRSELTSRMPGIPPQGELGWPLGFSVVTFVNAGLTTLNATALPQRPIKGNRLIVDIARNGATAVGLVTVDLIRIGTTPQQCSNQPNTSAMFANVAVGIFLELQQAQPGIECIVTYTLGLPALGVGDTVSIGTSLVAMTAG